MTELCFFISHSYTTAQPATPLYDPYIVYRLEIDVFNPALLPGGAGKGPERSRLSGPIYSGGYATALRTVLLPRNDLTVSFPPGISRVRYPTEERGKYAISTIPLVCQEEGGSRSINAIHFDQRLSSLMLILSTTSLKANITAMSGSPLLY